MHMVDPVSVSFDHSNYITTREQQMPGIDQQPHSISGISHCQLQFALGFHAGAHMVMERQRDTLAGTVLRQPRESLPLGHKFRFRQHRLVD